MEPRPIEVGPSKRRRDRRLAILATMSLLLAAWAFWPRLAYRMRLQLAERAVAADRLDEAEGRLDPLVAEHPAQSWPRFLRAQVARKRGEITSAEELLQRAIELGLPVEQARREHELLVERAVSDPLSGIGKEPRRNR